MKKIILLLLFIPLISQAQIKISDLPEATSLNNADLFLLTQGGVSKKLQFTTMKTNLLGNVTASECITKTSNNFTLGGIAYNNLNLRFDGSNLDKNFMLYSNNARTSLIMSNNVGIQLNTNTLTGNNLYFYLDGSANSSHRIVSYIVHDATDTLEIYQDYRGITYNPNSSLITKNIGNDYWVPYRKYTDDFALDVANDTAIWLRNWAMNQMPYIKIADSITVSSIKLPVTTNSTSGIIFKNNQRFFHDYDPPLVGGVEPVGHNIFIGTDAGNFTMGSTATQTYHASNNTGIGYQCLQSLTTGYTNTAVGYHSQQKTTTGRFNASFCASSLAKNTTGMYNSALGYSALFQNLIGDNNTAVGATTLNDNLADNNTAIGYSALKKNTTGYKQVALGVDAGTYISDGVTSNTTSDSSVYIGSNTRPLADNDVNEIVIGHKSVGNGSNTTTLGNSNTVKTYLKGDSIFGSKFYNGSLAKRDSALATLKYVDDHTGFTYVKSLTSAVEWLGTTQYHVFGNKNHLGYATNGYFIQDTTSAGIFTSNNSTGVLTGSSTVVTVDTMIDFQAYKLGGYQTMMRLGRQGLFYTNYDTTKFNDNSVPNLRKVKDEIYGNSFGYSKTLTNDISWQSDVSGTRSIGFGDYVGLNNFYAQGAGTYNPYINFNSNLGLTSLGNDSVALGIGLNGSFVDNRKNPTGVGYSANYHKYLGNLSWADKSYVDSVAGLAGITLSDSLLDADNTHHTLVPYSSKQSQLSFYRHAAMPDGTDTLKLNGIINATGFIGENKPYGATLTIKPTDDNYPFGPIFRLRKKNYSGVIKTWFDFTETECFTYNCINGDATPFFKLTWMDSIRFYQAGYYTNIGDINKNNYLQITHKGAITQKINNVDKFTVSTTGKVVAPDTLRTDKALHVKGPIKQTISGVTKFKVDDNGYIYNDVPHAVSIFMDSTVTITLSQNTWYQVTRQTAKTTWPTTEYVGFTESGDSIIIPYNGDYEAKWQVNITGVNAKDYEYRIMRRRSATNTEVWRYGVTSAGLKVLRPFESYISDAQVNDRYWIELRSTSSAPGNVTLHSGNLIFKTIHLDN